MSGPDGVCLPVNAVCSSNADCTSPVFNRCFSDVSVTFASAGLLTSGNTCLQGYCNQQGAACQPGSVCVQRVLPSSVPAPDVCSPLCETKTAPSGSSVQTCLPGLVCLTDAFPQSATHACATGFPGWLCSEDLNCVAGSCHDWGDVDQALSGLRTCSPSCASDADCLPFDGEGNPSVFSKFTCHNGVWRSLQSLFFSLACLRPGEACQLDPGAVCQTPSVDGGASPTRTCGRPDPRMAFGSLGGQAPSCVHGCSTTADCAAFAQAAHVPMTCSGLVGARQCLPALPYVLPCDSDGDCTGGLTCQLVVSGTHKGCTRGCSSSSDCAKDPQLGSLFACFNGICVLKTESGCMPPAAVDELCLGGKFADGNCVSPGGWPCDSDANCASGSCTHGRCQ
jgi:hypothetical protein